MYNCIVLYSTLLFSKSRPVSVKFRADRYHIFETDSVVKRLYIGRYSKGHILADNVVGLSVNSMQHSRWLHSYSGNH